MQYISDLVDNTSLTNNTLTNALNQMSQTSFTLDFPEGPEIESALAGLMIAVGIGLVLFGCRLFKAALFSLIMIAVAGLVYYIGVVNGQDPKVMFSVGIVLGFFCGLLAIKLWKLALFLVGASVGLVIFIVAKNVWSTAFISPAALYSGLLIPAIILGCLSVYMERYWLLISTPILGSFLAVQGIDHFANLDINVFGTLAGTDSCASDECYALWGGVAGLALLGMLIQYRYTAGFNHPTVVHKGTKYTKQEDTV